MRGWGLASSVVAVAILAGMGVVAAPRSADAEAPSPAQSANGLQKPQFEVWTGASAFVDAWSLYAGATAAAPGGLYTNGLRIRLVAGEGEYVNARSDRHFGLGSVAFGDLLLGYQHQLGSVTLKLFGGVTYEEHVLLHAEPGSEPPASGFGAKLALETWWNASDHLWASLDLSWSTLRDAYAARTRLGWRVLPRLSLGLEAEAFGKVDLPDTRGGAFVRYEWATGEISLSGGVASDALHADHARRRVDGDTPYATINVLTRF